LRGGADPSCRVAGWSQGGKGSEANPATDPRKRGEEAWLPCHAPAALWNALYTRAVCATRMLSRGPTSPDTLDPTLGAEWTLHFARGFPPQWGSNGRCVPFSAFGVWRERCLLVARETMPSVLTDMDRASSLALQGARDSQAAVVALSGHPIVRSCLHSAAPLPRSIDAPNALSGREVTGLSALYSSHQAVFDVRSGAAALGSASAAGPQGRGRVGKHEMARAKEPSRCAHVC
jgi:hypothetical protein